jgi:hypothetical protein
MIPMTYEYTVQTKNSFSGRRGGRECTGLDSFLLKGNHGEREEGSVLGEELRKGAIPGSKCSEETYGCIK